MNKIALLHRFGRLFVSELQLYRQAKKKLVGLLMWSRKSGRVCVVGEDKI
jgi:hypothetical protein